LAWLATFFALAAIWRVVLFVGTVIVLVPLVGMRGVAEMNAAPLAAAVDTLRDLNSRLQQPKNGEKHAIFPEKLPTVELSPVARKFYRFEYIPVRSEYGEIRSYRIEAVPSRRGCGLEISFTITSDNRIFWTKEGRPATSADTPLDQ